MDKHLISAFRFTDYKIHSISFELNSSGESIDEGAPVSVGINISTNDTLDSAIVELDFSLFQEGTDSDLPYKIKLSMVGYFEIEGKTNENDVVKLCKINGTAVMFPYIRSAITDITKIGNIQPLVLPTINIYKLIEAQEKLNKF